MENNTLHKLGIDIGSTTVKVAVLDEHDNLLFSDYERHFANIRETLSALIQKAFDQLGDRKVAPMITGSGGLTLAKHLDVPFVQEVISVSTALQHYAPQTDVAIELGGEDAKIIYFEGGNVEQRMNGICAGGTGSFIDQMASLIQTDASGLNEYAKNYKAIYPIAARCGVFAKTDIQPLINEGATREDLSASIFQAVVNQTISGLACGKPIRGHVAFLGGPLHFLSELKAAFIRTLNLDDEHAITPDNSHLYAAIGSALNCKPEQNTTLSSMLGKLNSDIHMEFEVLIRYSRIRQNMIPSVPAMTDTMLKQVTFPPMRVTVISVSTPVPPQLKLLSSVRTALYCIHFTATTTEVLFPLRSVPLKRSTKNSRQMHISYTPVLPATAKLS